MSLVTVLSNALRVGKEEYKLMRAAQFSDVETCGAEAYKNRLALGENGAFMKALLCDENMAGKLQMVYIDPPFFSKANYDAVIQTVQEEGDKKKLSVKHPAYGDIWSAGIESYLGMLVSRLMMIRDLLREDGTVWVHMDWHAVHYVRVLMDEIFGAENFINEVVWSYKSGGSGKKHFARKHDTILVYGKTKKYFFQPLKEKSYNRGFKPYHFKGVEEFQDEMGWYTMVNMKDVWQIDMVGRTSAERTGYATQKPEALLERILACSTREGDICADFFCGSGTLAAAAQKMNRRWICCDQGKLAVSTAYGRLLDDENRNICLQAQTSDDEMYDFREWIAPGELTAVLNHGILELTGCRIEIKKGELEDEDWNNLNEIAEKNPLQLVSYWTIDDNFDGRKHQTRHVLLRKKGELETRFPLYPPTDAGRKIHVVAVDLFGNRYETVL